MISGKNKLNKVVLSLGGNKGDVFQTFKKVIKAIEEQIGKALKSSSFYKTAAWGITNQPDFINQVIVIETQYNPTSLLDVCMQIEKELGRIRTLENRWKERTIDIDILYYNNEIISLTDLEIPHPQIENRKFILIPLTEIIPDYIHPKRRLSNKALLMRCKDELEVMICKCVDM